MLGTPRNWRKLTRIGAEEHDLGTEELEAVEELEEVDEVRAEEYGVNTEKLEEVNEVSAEGKGMTDGEQEEVDVAEKESVVGSNH